MKEGDITQKNRRKSRDVTQYKKEKGGNNIDCVLV
jgi:hypothetical protein